MAFAGTAMIALLGGTGAALHFGWWTGLGGETAELRGTINGHNDNQTESEKSASHPTDAIQDGHAAKGESATDDHATDHGGKDDEHQLNAESAESTGHGSDGQHPAEAETAKHYDIPARSPLVNSVRTLLLAQSDAAYGRIPVEVSQRDAILNTQALLKKWDPKDATRQDLEALAVYFLSGGNPRGLSALVDSIDPASKMADVIRGTRLFAMGDKEGARKAFSQLDVAAYSPALSARLSLVGAALADENDFDAQSKMLRSAASLAPGTLVEEAAYRRLLSLHIRKADPIGFEKVALRYMRRFPKSLYIPDFAASFLEAVIAFEERKTPLSHETIEKVARILPDDVVDDVLLGLGRQAAESGFKELCEYIGGSSYLAELSTPVQQQRMKLYSTACRVVDEPDAMLAILENLPVDLLSAPDTRLRDDAMRLAMGMRGEASKAEFERFFGPVLPDDDSTALLVSAAQQLSASEALLQETLW